MSEYFITWKNIDRAQTEIIIIREISKVKVKIINYKFFMNKHHNNFINRHYNNFINKHYNNLIILIINKNLCHLISSSLFLSAAVLALVFRMMTNNIYCWSRIWQIWHFDFIQSYARGYISTYICTYMNTKVRICMH